MKKYLLIWGGVLTFLFLTSSLVHTPPNEKTITVLYSMDDLGTFDTGASAGLWGENCLWNTPNFDAFASTGRRLRFFASNEKCGPSRLNWRLPNTPHDNGKAGTNIIEDGDVRALPRAGLTLAENCQNQGVFCAHIGKWHCGHFNGTPYETYNYSFSMNGGSWTYYDSDDETQMRDIFWRGRPWKMPNRATRTVFRKTKEYDGNSNGERIRTRNYAESRVKTFQDTLNMLFDVAIANGSGAYFFDYNETVGHSPFEIEAEKYMTALQALFNKGATLADTVNYTERERMMGVRKAQVEDWDVQFGRFVAKVNEAVAAGWTVNVLFISDNPAPVQYGYMNLPLTLEKGFYGSSIFVPCVLWSSDNTLYGVYNHLTTINDVYHTIADFIGLPPQAGRGKSMRQAVFTNTQLHPDMEAQDLCVGLDNVECVLAQKGTTIYLHRTSNLSTNANGSANFDQLYDEAIDWTEQNNLINTSDGTILLNALDAFTPPAQEGNVNNVPWFPPVNSRPAYTGQFTPEFVWDDWY